MKERSKDMRILVIGAGVLGCNLAANLYHAGKDVTLLARGAWYEQIRSQGLMIRNMLLPRYDRLFKIGKKFGIDREERRMAIRVINELKAEDRYEVIFVCAQFTQLDEIVRMLQKNPSRNIIFIGNDLRPKYYASLLKGRNVMFGFTLAAGHRAPDHVASIDLRHITVGDLKGHPSNKFLIRKIFENTAYRLEYESNIEDYLLTHAAVVVPVCYACYAVDGDLKKIGRDNSWIHLLIDGNIDVYRALERLGHEILPNTLSSYRKRSYRTKFFIFYKLMASTFLGKLCASDHAMSAISEMKALAKELDQLVERSGVEVPSYKRLKAMQDYI